MNEPSILDYLIDKLTFWRESTLDVPPAEQAAERGARGERAAADRAMGRTLLSQRWLVLIPLLLVWSAQLLLEPPGRSSAPAVILYGLGVLLLVVLIRLNIWKIPALQEKPAEDLNNDLRWRWFTVGLILSLAAFWFFGVNPIGPGAFSGNRFNVLNTFLWLAGMTAVLWSLWEPEGWWQKITGQGRTLLDRGLTLNPWQLVVLAGFGLAAFFRFYRLADVPPEMFSDHAEKLIDVTTVLRGEYPIYFIRNTGREAFQMYLTAAAAELFHTGISFLSLKLGTVLAGVLTLPFIYLLGKEAANRRVGLFAMVLAGVAYWPNVISRVALRFALYPFFAAPALYFLIRGLRSRRRNDFIYAGLFLGLGLHGYSPFRVVPVLFVVVLLVYLLHRPGLRRLKTALWGLLTSGLVSLLVFLPLLRYALGHWGRFSYRMSTRMTGLERAIPGNPFQIFLSNLSKSLVMFQWDNGEIWVHSIPGRPALGVISAGLFTLGVVLVIVRYVRKRSWIDLSLLLSIPILMLPSVLAIAFPNENPSLNRSGGALIPVFLLVGMALDSLWITLRNRYPNRSGKILAGAAALLVVLMSARINADLVFNQYYHQFRHKSWNTSELGEVITQFADTIGSYQQAWVVPYPHWVDTRLVGIHVEDKVVDYALWREDLGRTTEVDPPKLFLVKPEDQETLDELRDLYPDGVVSVYRTFDPSRNFILYTVLR